MREHAAEHQESVFIVSDAGISNIRQLFNQARVNGGSNYDSLKVAKCLVI